MLTIDGSQGEGGGQVLRTALALSLVTRAPFRMEKIRAGRPKPGLMRQHLTAVTAAAEVSHAKVHGAEVGSKLLEFRPGETMAGDYRFSVGTAGSITLVLQTILPALLSASGPSTLVLEGGTHNPMAPPFEFLDRVYAPLVRRMGAGLSLELERPGFYPAGGGRFRAEIVPGSLSPLSLVERGRIIARRATAMVSSLPLHVAERELDTVKRSLLWSDDECRVVTLDAAGPGNVVELEVECEHITELTSGFGERGLRAEVVAERACAEMSPFLESDVPVGAHLADQLLLLLAVAGGGEFRTVEPTLHTRTQIAVIQQYLKYDIYCEPDGDAWRIAIRT